MSDLSSQNCALPPKPAIWTIRRARHGPTGGAVCKFWTEERRSSVQADLQAGIVPNNATPRQISNAIYRGILTAPNRKPGRQRWIWTHDAVSACQAALDLGRHDSELGVPGITVAQVRDAVARGILYRAPLTRGKPRYKKVEKEEVLCVGSASNGMLLEENGA